MGNLSITYIEMFPLPGTTLAIIRSPVELIAGIMRVQRPEPKLRELDRARSKAGI